jgi:hypothetical protein
MLHSFGIKNTWSVTQQSKFLIKCPLPVISGKKSANCCPERSQHKQRVTSYNKGEKYIFIFEQIFKNIYIYLIIGNKSTNSLINKWGFYNDVPT